MSDLHDDDLETEAQRLDDLRLVEHWVERLAAVPAACMLQQFQDRHLVPALIERHARRLFQPGRR